MSSETLRFLTSNCAECFNGRLLWARRLFVCTLLECVRTVIGHWFIERRNNALARTQEFSEYVTIKIGKSIEEAKTMDVEAISATKFKVTVGTQKYVVDLNAKKCTCWEFDI